MTQKEIRVGIVGANATRSWANLAHVPAIKGLPGVKLAAVATRNIERDSHVRLKVREELRYRWHEGTAHLLSDDDPRERQRWLATQLPSSAGNARAVRLFGTQLLSIRIDLGD